MKRKNVSMLEIFYEAQIFNFRYYFSQLLGAIAFGFAWVSLTLTYAFPEMSEVMKDAANQFILWSIYVRKTAMERFVRVFYKAN